MLAVADRQQGFFDAAWCSDLLPEGSIYSLLAEHGDRIVRDEDFADCYSERQGRPSIPPSLLAKVLLLAYRDGLSDERAMDAVRFDLRWKVALDLPVDHPGFHPTSLVRFRARLLLHGKERLVFERSLELATELGLLCGPAEQILDSTPMLGAAAVQDTATLVRSGGPQADRRGQGRRRTGRRRAHFGASLRLLAPAREARRRLAGQGRPRGAPRRGRKGRGAGAAGGRGGRRARAQTRRSPRRRSCCARSSARSSSSPTTSVPRPRGGRRSRQILSAEDPDMRHARSSAARPFTGYKIHAAADAEAPLLTSITLSPGNEHDGQHAGTLVDQQPEQRRPARVIGDTAYGNIEVREQLEQRSISVLAPVHSTSPKDGTIPKDEFRDRPRGRHRHLPPGQDETDLQAQAEPAGAKPRSGRPFFETDCEPCPLRDRCAPTGRREIRISRREDLRQAALRALADPAEREHLKRTRPRIERLLGLIVHRYRGRKSRYLGARKSSSRRSGPPS